MDLALAEGSDECTMIAELWLEFMLIRQEASELGLYCEMPCDE